MGALNLPSASDLERLTRRVRSVSQRLEGIEDGLDRLDDHMRRPGTNGSLEDRLANIERALERLEAGQARDEEAEAAKSAATSRATSKASTAKPDAPDADDSSARSSG